MSTSRAHERGHGTKSDTTAHAHDDDGNRDRETISDRWCRVRDRVLSNARFQRWAARFPLTRGIARRRESALFDLCAGFVYSQVLHATVQLGVLERLAERPHTVAELSSAIGLGLDATQRLVDAAVSLSLVEARPRGRYGLGMHGASFMGNPAVARMVEHHSILYRDLADPVALLRSGGQGTELGRFWSYAGPQAATSGTRDVAAYSALMAGSVSLVAEDILEAYPHARHRAWLDVAGGEGAFLEAVAARSAHLSLMLFDLPEVAARARDRFEAAGLAERATAFGGDVFSDPLPAGADLVSLVRVLHDHDDPEALRILQAIRRALPPRGVLLVAEPMAGTAGAEAMGAAYFGFYLLAMGQGRPRTANELTALLRAAGFSKVRSQPTRRPMLTRLLVASTEGSPS